MYTERRYMETIIDRYEQKYLLSKKEYNSLIKYIDDYLVKDRYFVETIYNVYFDNDDYELINRSIEKPIYKEKVRMRSYYKTDNDTNIFLEIKKKYEDNSNKRRVIISYKEYLDYINKGVIPKCDKQIMSEIDYCFKKYKLKPKIKLVYDRLAYNLRDDDSFRITFDTNVRYNLNNFDFNNDEDTMFMNDGYIMEIKTFNGIPLWLNKVLNKLNIYPTSYSKVGKIYERERIINV